MTTGIFDVNGRQMRAFSGCMPPEGVWCWFCLRDGRFILAEVEIYDYDPELAPATAKVPMSAHYYSIGCCKPCADIWGKRGRRDLIMTLLPSYIDYYQLCLESLAKRPYTEDDKELRELLKTWFEQTLKINREGRALYRKQKGLTTSLGSKVSDAKLLARAEVTAESLVKLLEISRQQMSKAATLLDEVDDELAPRRELMERRRQQTTQAAA
jgi:hypothetical protein